MLEPSFQLLRQRLTVPLLSAEYLLACFLGISHDSTLPCFKQVQKHFIRSRNNIQGQLERAFHCQTRSTADIMPFVFQRIYTTVTGSRVLFIIPLVLGCGTSWPLRFMSGNVVLNTWKLRSTCIKTHVSVTSCSVQIPKSSNELAVSPSCRGPTGVVQEMLRTCALQCHVPVDCKRCKQRLKNVSIICHLRDVAVLFMSSSC